LSINIFTASPQGGDIAERRLMSKHPFTGLGVALVTPFTDDNKIDYKSLERLLEHLLRDQAMDFLVVHGTTGESPCLTRPEREAVTRRVVEQVAGRCPIVVGLGGNDTVETGERFQAMDTHGVSGILSVVPYYNKPSQEGIFQHFSYLAQRSELPLILYNVPSRVGVNMASDTVVRLARTHSNIVGVKEASGFPQQAGQITSSELPEDFVVLSGDDALCVAFAQNGARGVISVAGNAYPRLTSRLIHLAMDGRYNEADMIQTAMRQLNTQLFQEGNPAGIKALLHLMGLIDTECLRLPLVCVSQELRERLDETRRVLDGYAERLDY
jgi:dihydrodipicolinate synthase